MLWHGRPNSFGLWLPEDKKANMRHGRENIVAYGCLTTPAPTSHQYTEKTQLNLFNFHLGNGKYFPFRQCLKETRFRSDLTLTIESHLKLTYVHTVSTVPLKNDSTIKNMKN